MDRLLNESSDDSLDRLELEQLLPRLLRELPELLMTLRADLEQNFLRRVTIDSGFDDDSVGVIVNDGDCLADRSVSRHFCADVVF